MFVICSPILQIITHQKQTSSEPGEMEQNNYSLPMIHVRLINACQPIALKNLKANYYGKKQKVSQKILKKGNSRLYTTTIFCTAITINENSKNCRYVLCDYAFCIVGKFVSVKGTVVRVSNIKPLCTLLAFECGTCAYVQVSVPIRV